MLTSRGWWFLIIVLFIFALGAFVVANYTTLPAILALTLLLWFLGEWIVFNFSVHGAVAHLRAERWVLQGGRTTPILWANVPFQVQLRVFHRGRFTIRYALMEDRFPAATDLLEGRTDTTATIRRGEAVEILYTARCPAPGVVRFEGVRVRVADVQGFFYRRVFLRDPVEFLILPPLVDEEGNQRADKRFNVLPPPGIHRLRRPGAGDELHDLRDYQPGDPPKMIAWKASARKDKLITKEYESDVPVRCTLFLDTSEGVRLGPTGNTLLTRLAGISAVIAQAAAANRDLVGLTTFDDRSAQVLRPARTQTHMINVLRTLAEVAALQPSMRGVPIETMMRRAYPLAHELYPELMTKKINTLPLSRLWQPLLDRWWGWIVLFILVAPPALAAYKLANILGGPPLPGPLQKIYQTWMAATFDFAVRVTPKVYWVLRIALALVIWFVVLCLPSVLAAGLWLLYGIRGWFGQRAAELRQRKQLAALLSLQDGAGPDAIERYIHDDNALARRISAFLEHHRLRCPVPMYDDDGRYRYRCAEKAHVLAYQLIRAVGVARDNELYVILADLAELGDDLEPLVRACRVARARRHHVMVIVPWPADIPIANAPLSPVPESASPSGRRKAGEQWPASKRQRRIAQIVQDTLTRQYHEAFRAMRRALSQVGASVFRVNDGDPVRLVLDHLDRLRGMRSRR
ncbi:MAG: DUF58 domain-containing protein [Gemmataceae bacterium]|nr:DUF58 domain-containing protein [Gemmata sp.]MDW8196083.1 DUF58 domain-containing protein [Gemmataceae bacterium]